MTLFCTMLWLVACASGTGLAGGWVGTVNLEDVVRTDDCGYGDTVLYSGPVPYPFAVGLTASGAVFVAESFIDGEPRTYLGEIDGERFAASTGTTRIGDDGATDRTVWEVDGERVEDTLTGSFKTVDTNVSGDGSYADDCRVTIPYEATRLTAGEPVGGSGAEGPWVVTFGAEPSRDGVVCDPTVESVRYEGARHDRVEVATHGEEATAVLGSGAGFVGTWLGDDLDVHASVTVTTTEDSSAAAGVETNTRTLFARVNGDAAAGEFREHSYSLDEFDTDGPSVDCTVSWPATLDRIALE